VENAKILKSLNIIISVNIWLLNEVKTSGCLFKGEISTQSRPNLHLLSGYEIMIKRDIFITIHSNNAISMDNTIHIHCIGVSTIITCESIFKCVAMVTP